MQESRSTFAVARSSSLLTGREQTAVQAILEAALVRRISAKDNITIGGHGATHMFLVQRGRARYYHLTKHGEVVLLACLGPGDVIGLVALLKTQSTYMATAEAVSDCELLSWDHSVIRKLASSHPLLGENGLNIALEYVRAYIGRHVGLATKMPRKGWPGRCCGSATNRVRSIPMESKSAQPTMNSGRLRTSARLPPAVW